MLCNLSTQMLIPSILNHLVEKLLDDTRKERKDVNTAALHNWLKFHNVFGSKGATSPGVAGITIQTDYSCCNFVVRNTP